jgi:glutathione S-transferase
MRLYYHPRSGHSHRALAFLKILKVDAELVIVDLKAGEAQSAEFRKLNSFAQIPVLVDGDVVVPDSNAILIYLAKKFDRDDWLPEDPAGSAAVQRWLSVAAGELYRGPAMARMVTVWGEDHDAARAIEQAHAFLSLLDTELSGRDWLAASHPTIADIALYAYVALAPEGGVDTTRYLHVQRWLKRVDARPDFLPPLETVAGLRVTGGPSDHL